MPLVLPDFDAIFAHAAQWIREPVWLAINSAMVKKRGRQARPHAWGPAWPGSGDQLWYPLCGQVSGHIREDLLTPDSDRRCPMCENRRDKYLKVLEWDTESILKEGVTWKSAAHGVLALFARDLINRATHDANIAEMRAAREAQVPPHKPKRKIEIEVDADPDDEAPPGLSIRHMLGRGKLVQDTSTMKRNLIVSLPELFRMAAEQGLLPPIPDRAKVELVAIGTDLPSGGTQSNVGLRIYWNENVRDHVVAETPKPTEVGGGLHVNPLGAPLAEGHRPAEPVKLPPIVLKPKESARINAMRAGRLKECKTVGIR